MKDNRVNLKIKPKTRDRIMSLRYRRGFKNLDITINNLIDNFEQFMNNESKIICLKCGEGIEVCNADCVELGD